MSTEIKIHPEFQNLIPPLAPEELGQLKKNILLEGCRDALITWQGWLIDGHNRYGICQENGIEYKTNELPFEDESKVKLWIINNQRGRRNLSTSQLATLAAEALTLYEKEAETRMKAGVNIDPTQKLAQGESTELVAEKFNTNKQYVKDAKKLKEQRPEVFQEVKSGKLNLNKAMKDFKKDVRRERDAALGKSMESVPSSVDLKVCDFRQLETQPLDLILTDPPYPKEFLPLWKDLGEFAMKNLKPGKFLVAYSGQMYLPEIYQMLTEAGLIYYWTFCLHHIGATQIVNARNVMCGWKPILVFQKPPYSKLEWPPMDFIDSEKREKEGHDWQQSESGVVKLVEVFSKPGDLVLDPFCGSGTFPYILDKMKRSVITCDIEEENINITKSRFHDQTGILK